MSQAGSSFARMRPSMTVVAGILSATMWSATAFGADKVTFLTSWFAQAEHGGFYQAKATGLYEKAGLDVTLKMGGPQVNGAQLLLAGETDFMMGYDLQVLKMLEQGLPVITVGTSFQFDLQGIMAPRQRREPRRSQGQDDPGGDAGPHDLVAMAEGEIQVYRRADQALHVQPAALLRRQERGAAVLSLVGTVPGQAARGARQVLPVRAGRLSALRHDHGHDPRLRRQESGGDRALRQGVARRMEELSDRSRAGKCAHQGRQSQDERRADRLRTSSNCARSRCWTAAMPRPWASGSSRKRAGKRPTISWSRPACSSPRSTGNRGSPTGT